MSDDVLRGSQVDDRLAVIVSPTRKIADKDRAWSEIFASHRALASQLKAEKEYADGLLHQLSAAQSALATSEITLQYAQQEIADLRVELAASEAAREDLRENLRAAQREAVIERAARERAERLSRRLIAISPIPPRSECKDE